MTGKPSLTKVVLLALGLVGLPMVASAQMAVEYYHLDAIGNVLVVTDNAGAVVEQHDYDVFGQEVNAQAGSQPKRFTGKERDQETGWDYFGARYYGSKIGRFTTVDPVYTWQANLVDPQRWNRYAYALNNPLRNVDPDGKVPIPVIVAGAYAAYEVLSQAYDAYTLGTTLANPNATSGEKAAATGGFVIGAIAPGGGYGTVGKAAVGKADDVARALKRGRESEARVLDALGEAKNNAKVKGCEGCSIPDYQNASTVGEIKDAARVDDTRQIRIQRDAAATSGREHVIHTGANTSVSRNVERGGTRVERQADLGPK